MHNQDRLTVYLQERLPKRSNFFLELEKVAAENHVPIMDPYSMETVLQLLRLYKPKKILEIGTAIGYSSLRMAECLPDAKIITIERDEKRVQEAKNNITKAGKNEQINLLEGDAFALLNEVKKYAPFDFLFIDAAKAQYQRFFEMYEPLVSDGGLIITDNVLFKGYIYEHKDLPKRQRSLVEKIQKFNDWLLKHPQYDSLILPVGDGILVSIKK